MVDRSAAPARDQPRPIVVAAAIIERQGRYLIAQRRDDATLGGLWEFPGGKCRAGETAERCLHRELDEELGVRVSVTGPERVITHRYPHGLVELHFFHCALTAGDPEPLGCQSLRWVAPHELTKYAFPQANGSLIHALSADARPKTVD